MSSPPKPKPTPDENAAVLKAIRAEHGTLEKAYEQAIDGSRRRQKENERLQGEGNTLRDQLMTATLELERLRGYLAGRRDAEPPRMIPAPQVENFELRPVQAWRQNAPKPWYHL